MNVDTAVISQVIDLRKQGLTLQQIGERFGKADSFAFKIIKEHAPDLRRVKVARPLDPTKPAKVVPLKRSEQVLPLGRLELRCFMGDLTLNYDADDPDESLATHGRMRTHINETAGHDKDIARSTQKKASSIKRKKGGA